MNQSSHRSSYVIVLWVLLVLYCSSIHPSAAEPAPTATTSPPATVDPEHLRAAREALRHEREKLVAQRNVATPDSVAQALVATIKVLNELDAVYGEHLSALERRDSVRAELEALEKSRANGSPTPVAASFPELDQLQEELTLQLGRAAAVQAAVEAADGAAQAARSQATATPTRDDTVPPPLVDAQQRLAAGRAALRQVELEAAQQEAALYQARVADLRRRITAIKTTGAALTKTVLDEQLRHLERDALQLEREQADLAEQEPLARKQLNRTRERLAAADIEAALALEAEVEARRTEAEGIEARRQHLARRLALLDQAKTTWEHRYAVFSAQRIRPEWLDWKETTRTELAALGREEQGLALRVADWRNRLLTLENLDGPAAAATTPQRHWLQLRRKQAQQVLQSIEQLRIAIENSRRLKQKLIDDITERTARRSFGEWTRLIMDYQIRQNTVADWVRASAITSLAFLLLRLLRRGAKLLLRQLIGRGWAQYGEDLLDTVERTGTIFLLALALGAGALALQLDGATQRWVRHAVQAAVIMQMAVWASDMVRDWIYHYLARRTKRDKAALGTLSIFNFTTQVAVWTVALMALLNSFGVDVTALVAGLGIGGIAIALALQRVVGDLLASLSIVLDKPFVIGDFIAFDNFSHLGEVEYIGIKTTRIRSLSGEQIVCANSDLLSTHIRNFKRMRERRVEFNIGIKYETTPDQLDRIPTLLREIIESQEHTRFDRAHFFAYGDFALQFAIVYFVLSPDYNQYMDTQQAINLAIYRRFQERNIEFAYPLSNALCRAPLVPAHT